MRVSICSAPDRSRLRLVSACALLKIAQCSNYKELISPEQFLRLALTMQVCQCYTVKVGVVGMIISHCSSAFLCRLPSIVIRSGLWGVGVCCEYIVNLEVLMFLLSNACLFVV